MIRLSTAASPYPHQSQAILNSFNADSPNEPLSRDVSLAFDEGFVCLDALDTYIMRPPPSIYVRLFAA
jgi:hypothetical protein